MDFFGSQDDRKRQSIILIACFAVAMLAMAAVVHVVAVLVSVPVKSEINFYTPSTPAKAFIVLIWLTCLIGCFFRILDVRAGGSALARRFGAVSVSADGRYREEKELVDIVNEIAVASGCELPEIFVLHRETAINAFVVGGFNGKEALVVSRGAIEQLSQEELSAVVAHEFGHIAQDDIPLNMKLLVALGGLNAIDEVGRLLMARFNGKLVAQPGLVVGFVLRALGSIGVFFGRLLRSAVSRQREFLADACAVQFTRNPASVADALTAIRDQSSDSALHNVHAEEISHLCFQTDESSKWYQRLFATHPPIQKRIDAIDPHHDIKARRKSSAATQNASGTLYSSSGSTVVPFSSDEGLVGGVLSDQASVLLVDSNACLAVLHAIFVSDDPAKSKTFYAAIAFAYNKLFAHQVKELRTTLYSELQTNQMAIINKATAELCENIKTDNRQRLLKSLEKLVSVEKELTLMNYATLQLIRRKLNVEFPTLESKAGGQGEPASGSYVKTFDTMGKEFALLLSMIVGSSGTRTETQDKLFADALKCYTKDNFRRRLADEPGIVAELEASFQTLYVQPRPIREAFVKHCVELAQADGHIARDEKALLDLFAASLKCEALAA